MSELEPDTIIPLQRQPKSKAYEWFWQQAFDNGVIYSPYFPLFEQKTIMSPSKLKEFEKTGRLYCDPTDEQVARMKEIMNGGGDPKVSKLMRTAMGLHRFSDCLDQECPAAEHLPEEDADTVKSLKKKDEKMIEYDWDQLVEENPCKSIICSPTPEQLDRLTKSLQEGGQQHYLIWDHLESQYHKEFIDRQNFVDGVDIEPKDCPDCKGSGKYNGFQVVEDCRACKGTGATW